MWPFLSVFIFFLLGIALVYLYENTHIPEYYMECQLNLSCRSSPWGKTALHAAAVSGKLEITKLLVEKNAELDPNPEQVLKILTPVSV